jgi:hypothetical protein
MNITLTKIKRHPDMSEETMCFSASIMLDGKAVGTVRNDGRGGCNMYDWNDHKVGQALFDWAKTQQTEFDFDKLDQVIDKLLDKDEERRELKRLCRGKTLFRLKGDKVDQWRIVKHTFIPAVKVFLVKEYGDKIERIANEEIVG